MTRRFALLALAGVACCAPVPEESDPIELGAGAALQGVLDCTAVYTFGAKPAALVKTRLTSAADVENPPYELPIRDDITELTRQLQAALEKASDNHGCADAVQTGTPSGTPQGKLVLPAGVYYLDKLDMPSNVRLEIHPGATLFNAHPTGGGGATAIFQFGVGASAERVSNITITTTQNGYVPGNKPLHTAFRGNNANDLNSKGALQGPYGTGTYGMSNLKVLPTSVTLQSLRDGSMPYWGPRILTMFVMDIDPRVHPSTDRNNHAFQIRNAEHVVIENVFAIQNAERPDPAVSCLGPCNGACEVGEAGSTDCVRASANPVSVIKPNSGATAAQNPSDITMRNLFSILSPSGAGPVQIQSCTSGCAFEDLFGHGGVVLRMETDAYPPADPDRLHDCVMHDHSSPDNGWGVEEAGPNHNQYDGMFGFENRTYMKISGLTGNHIEGAQGNAVVYYVAHCRHNGVATVSYIRGTGMRRLVATSNEGGVHGNGTFSGSSLVQYLKGTPAIELEEECTGTPACSTTEDAQDADPQNNTYTLVESEGAVNIGASAVKVQVGLSTWDSTLPFYSGAVSPPLPGAWATSPTTSYGF